MRKAVLRAVMLGAWVLAAAPAASAAAQHGTSGWASIPMDPRSSALLEVQTAGFDLPGRSGVWETWAARVEYAFVPWFSLAARPVLAYIDYDDSRPSEFGLSDLEVVPKARVWKKAAGWPASVSVGLSVELPTGDADTGTGNGHVSLFPFVTFSSVPVRGFMLHAMVGDRFVVSGEHDAGGEHDADAHAHAGHVQGTDAPAPHGSVIMPHGEHELSVHAGACFMLPMLVISPGIEWMQSFEPVTDTQLVAQLEVALVPRKELRFALGVDVPLVSEPRYEWRARMMTAWLF